MRRRIEAGQWALAKVAVVAFLALGGIGASVAGAQPDPAAGGPSVSVTAGPRWGRSTPGEWVPYVVTVKNDGVTDVEGEVVLVPNRDAPPANPLANPAAFAAAIGGRQSQGTWIQTGVMVGGRKLTVPLTQADPLTASAFPHYRAPVTLAPGTEKTFTMMVVEAPNRHGAKVVGDNGRVVATFSPPPPAPPPLGATNVTTLAVMTSVPEAAGRLDRATGSGYESLLSATRFSGTARDFPDDAIELKGLRALVIADFDTSVLVPPQLQAIKDYVALGGTLLLAGGASGARTLAPLLDITPLVPSATAPVPLNSLGQPTEVAIVVTGELRPGARVSEFVGDSVPFIVEANYGSGRVVLMTYDPFADPIGSDPALAKAAWERTFVPALGLVDTNRGAPLTPLLAELTGRIAPHEQIWSRAFETPAWPRRPGSTALAILGAYLVLAAGLAVLVARSRRHTGRVWPAVGMTAVIASIAVALGGAARAPVVDSVVEVSMVGPHTVLTTSYHGFVALGRGETSVNVPPGAVASTVFALPTYPGGTSTPDLALRGAGGGVVTAVGKREVSMQPEPQKVRNVIIEYVHHSGGVESHLRAEGAIPLPDMPHMTASVLSDFLVGPDTRIKGTITNRSRQPLRNVRGQLQDGSQARLADVIPPGATVQVDSPIVAATTSPIMLDLAALAKTNPAVAAALKESVNAAGNESLQAMLNPPEPSESDREELVMFGVASRALTSRGQIAVVALGDLGDRRPDFGSRTQVNKMSVVVQAATLEWTPR